MGLYPITLCLFFPQSSEHMITINVDDLFDNSVDNAVVGISFISDTTATYVSSESHTNIIYDVTDIQNEVKDGNDTYKQTAEGKLDQGKFLDTRKTVELLLKSVSSKECIPRGLKENVYFIVNNAKNLKKRLHNGKSSFSDDCGVWDTSAGASPKSYYLLSDEGNLTMIFFVKMGSTVFFKKTSPAEN
ncbi:hypothetical protein CHS0354_037617 [Potamilus streckersoni]|uniref:Uncharacterized protein n=1 Tax=Potamilus streckersoni TaxID=2493646 RepID=A0AAE0RUR4_9BIVA|nr:hypothetical protein CHS0354_037617 [Potamilus streckersoni]